MDESPFNDMPAEIRNMIYEFTFANSAPVKVRAKYPQSNRLQLSRESKETHPAALLQTCKQIRAECLDCFYLNVTFDVEAKSIDELVRLPKALLSTLDIQRRNQLRRLRVIFLQPLGYGFFENDPLDREGRKWILKSMVEMCDEASNLPRCNIKYVFFNQDLSEALKRQGLPCHLTCDLKNFQGPWKSQGYALVQPIKHWMQKRAQPKPPGAVLCVKMAWIYKSWTEELLKVAAGRKEDVQLSNA